MISRGIKSILLDASVVNCSNVKPTTEYYVNKNF